MLIYGELAARWYRLLDPVEDHRDEAACYEALLLRGASREPEMLLELGAGAGNNAFYLKRRFRCTLTDRSPEMLALSRQLNEDCEHLLGDMRSLRLGTSFDLVFVHDAVMYITTGKTSGLSRTPRSRTRVRSAQPCSRPTVWRRRSVSTRTSSRATPASVRSAALNG